MSYIGNSPGVASQRVTTTLTATAGQTQFTTQSGYVLGYVDVYLNGAKLVNGSDFEAITGTYITLFAGASAGDVVELISYVPRGLSDGYTKAEADAKFLDVGGDTATGALSLATATLSGNLTLNGGTANGVGYLNASKVLTTGSTLTFDGTFLKLGTTSSTNKLLIDTAVSNAGNIQLPRGGYIGFSNAADTANSEYVFANAGNLELGVNGSSRVYIDSTGNVGIGGTSVTLKSKKTLQVLGFVKIGDDNGNGLLSLGDIASTGANVAVWRGAGGPYAGVGNYLNLGGYDGITFTTGNTSIDSQTERMRIDSSGNIFIGNTTTNTNSSKLVVNGTISQTVGGTQYLVVDQSDIGTAQNQIPLNQYLGSMAFQDRESINFTGGTGALSSLDIAAVSAQLNVSANDVFVYDTSKDSDGGAWRKRTQHTSWYNEQLNTPTRGSRREFPAVAVIVCTTNTMTVYDGDDPTLPMWMVFSPNGLIDWPTSTHTRLIAGALNGGIVVVSEDGGLWFRFIDDTTHIIYSSLTYNVTSDKSIVNRNGATSYNASGGAVNTYAAVGYAYNDVAITVLPNAPIDTATGLPTPTIAIAGSSGLSVIQNTGGVATYVPSGSQIQKVAWGSDGSLWVTTPHVSGVVGYRLYYYKPYTVATGALSSPTSVYGHATGIALNVSGGEVPGGGGYFNSVKVTAPNEVSFASIGVTSQGQCLTKLSHNTAIPSSSLVAFVKTKYNTGWMVGDIKGAWLSDTTQETILSTELVTNGDFSSGTSGWTAVGSGASISVSSGQLNITTGTEAWAGAYTTVPVVSGKTYVITGTIVSTNGWAGISGSMAGANSGSKVFNGAYPSGSTATPYMFTYTATSTGTLYVTIDHSNTTSNTTIVADNISVRLADIDRSVNRRGLQVFGGINKTPVAVGADLVAYSGFNTSNYLYAPNALTSNIGTGDFSVYFWSKHDGGAVDINVGPYTQAAIAANGMRIAINSAGELYAINWTNAGWNGYYGINIGYQLNTWNLVHVIRRSGVIYFYLNGVLKASGSFSYDLTGSTHFTVGSNSATVSNCPVSLVRISLSTLTQEQITKMYNDEKALFQENAKSTLYGTSDQVIALAYDEDTKRLHVGTSSGRSVFQGLRRVENTTTAVTAAISAVDGLVAEN